MSNPMEPYPGSTVCKLSTIFIYPKLFIKILFKIQPRLNTSLFGRWDCPNILIRSKEAGGGGACNLSSNFSIFLRKTFDSLFGFPGLARRFGGCLQIRTTTIGWPAVIGGWHPLRPEIPAAPPAPEASRGVGHPSRPPVEQIGSYGCPH